MFLPIRTNIEPRRTPYANYLFIAANFVIFLLTLNFQSGEPKDIVRPYELVPLHPEVWQFVTYAFLHAGWWHIIGNMFFLYLFGNNVNDKLGNVGYACFYLAGAVFSALGHCWIHAGSPTPILGASGAVAAVTGAFLVLYPRTEITVMYVFFFIGTWDLPAILFIAIKMIIVDNLLMRVSNVAYDAHLAGYAYGILVSIGLLSTKLISGTGLDLWTLIRQWNRRRQYRDVTGAGYDPFTGRKRIDSREVERPLSPGEQKIRELRGEIGSRIDQGNISAAAQLYLELINLDPGQVLPRQQLLDIANQLMASGQWEQAARAYETFMTHYGSYEYSEQVQLMLGIIYARYIKDNVKAKENLGRAIERLRDPAQIKMAKDELARIAQQ
jgi:membrane associated rhomboid family serine protease